MRKPRVRRYSAWPRCLIVLPMMLPIGSCGAAFDGLQAVGSLAGLGGSYFSYKAAEKGEPVIVTPEIVEYDTVTQRQAAEELARCDCPALGGMVADYLTLRDRIRAAKGE